MQLKRKLSALLLSAAILTSQMAGNTVWAAQDREQTAARAADQGKILMERKEPASRMEISCQIL